MQQTTELKPQPTSRTGEGAADPGRFLIASVAMLVVLAILWFGFQYLRSNDAPQIVGGLIAIVWGVGGIAALFTVANMMVEALSNKWRGRIQPYVFVGPAILMLGIFLLLPAIQTFYLSLFDSSSTIFVGLENFSAVFTNRAM